MKLLSPKLHGIIDYVSVGGLVLAPTLPIPQPVPGTDIEEPSSTPIS